MVSTALQSAACICALALAASAGRISARDPGRPGFIHLPVNARREITPPSRLSKRAEQAEAVLKHYGTGGYTVNITLGSPGQVTEVVIDTGSKELWVNPDCSTANRSALTFAEEDNPLGHPDYCMRIGRYDAEDSSTAERIDGIEDTRFQYLDGTFADIEYWADGLQIGEDGDLAIESQVFGVATDSNMTGIGIMGLGPWSWGWETRQPYPLILQSLKDEGVLNREAFSLDLRDWDDPRGSLIFGGVDFAKFYGPLQRIPFTVREFTVDGQTYNETDYFVNVTAYSLTLPNSTETSEYDLPEDSDGQVQFLLDTGASPLLLPAGMQESLCADLNGTYPSEGLCIVSCGVRDMTGGLTFEFGDFGEMTIGYENLIAEYEFDGFPTFCNLNAIETFGDTETPAYILGAPFLRSSYAVFDWEEQAVHLAQAADCGDNVVPIEAGEGGIPEGDGDCEDPDSGAMISKMNGLAFGTAVLVSCFWVVS